MLFTDPCKQNRNAPNKSRTNDLPVTNSDQVPLLCQRLHGDSGKFEKNPSTSEKGEDP